MRTLSERHALYMRRFIFKEAFFNEKNKANQQYNVHFYDYMYALSHIHDGRLPVRLQH